LQGENRVYFGKYLTMLVHVITFLNRNAKILVAASNVYWVAMLIDIIVRQKRKFCGIFYSSYLFLASKRMLGEVGLVTGNIF